MAKSRTEPVVPVVGDTVAETPRVRHRSPNFPFINLERAIAQTRALYGTDRLRDVPLRVACQRWEYKIGGSQADQTVAALKAFGLVEVTGTGDNRMLRVSERAYRILGGARDATEQIKDAALAPSIHAELWQRFGTTGQLAGDDVLHHYLLFDRQNGRFNEDSVDTFIARFRETISFARLESGDRIGEAAPDQKKVPEVGDWVQWESQGVAQFPEPRRMVGRSGDGAWIFVEGSQTGLPAEQIIRVDAPNGKAVAPMVAPSNPQPPAAPPNPHFQSAGAPVKQDVFTADTGEVVVRWPAVLSQPDYDDIASWLEMLKGKIKRSVKSDNKGQENADA